MIFSTDEGGYQLCCGSQRADHSIYTKDGCTYEHSVEEEGMAMLMEAHHVEPGELERHR